MALMSRPTHDPKLTRWWWRTLREWIYELIDPLWGAFRGENSDDIALANVTGINDVSASELAALDGLTATTSELNILSGLTADASELNKADRTVADGIAEALKNVVLDANKDILGKRYDINQSLLNALVQGPYMRFDGADDYVKVIDDEAIQDLFADGGTFEAWIYPLSDGETDLGRIVYKYNWAIFVSNDDGNCVRLELTHSRTGHPGEWYTANIVPLNRWTHICIVYKSNVADEDPIFYVNGEAVAITEKTTPTGDPASDVGWHLFIGADRNNGRNFDGSIVGVRLHNRSLGAEEIQSYASRMSIPYADQGADQSDKVTNGEDWTGASGSTPPNNWSDTGSGTATYIIRNNTAITNFGDDKALELSVSGGSKTLYQSVAQASKRYRVSFVYRNLDGSSSSFIALGSDGNKVTLQNTGISGDGVVFEQELVADGTDLKFFVDSGGTLQIDHVQVIQIGCVAAYLPEGITHAQWLDTGGNELQGSVDGAVPMNLPPNHVTRYIKLGITGDTTLTDAVPAGYRIKSMVANVTGASAGMRLNVGTSAGGTDVVNNQDISANGLFDLTVAKHIFSLSSAQSLYVNDDGGTAWSGVSVDLYIEMERVR